MEKRTSMELNHISLYREHEDNPTADQVACYIFPAPRERSLHAQKKKNPEYDLKSN